MTSAFIRSARRASLTATGSGKDPGPDVDDQNNEEQAISDVLARGWDRPDLARYPSGSDGASLLTVGYVLHKFEPPANRQVG
jgi:hypothetical protein